MTTTTNKHEVTVEVTGVKKIEKRCNHCNMYHLNTQPVCTKCGGALNIPFTLDKEGKKKYYAFTDVECKIVGAPTTKGIEMDYYMRLFHKLENNQLSVDKRVPYLPIGRKAIVRYENERPSGSLIDENGTLHVKMQVIFAEDEKNAITFLKEENRTTTTQVASPKEVGLTKEAILRALGLPDNVDLSALTTALKATTTTPSEPDNVFMEASDDMEEFMQATSGDDEIECSVF